MVGPPKSSTVSVRRSRAPRAARATFVVGAVVFAAVVSAGGGCSPTQYVKVRSAPRNPLSDQLGLATRSGPKPSERTMQMVRRYDAAADLKGDPHKLVERFQDILKREPSIELVYAIAELAYIFGKRSEASNEKAALDFFETSVAYSYLYLFDERFGPARNPYDPQFRGSCELYNLALESALRIVKKRGQLVPGATHTIESAARRCDVTITLRSPSWHLDEFEGFEFVSDYEVSGLTNQYRTYGLGVPLIAVRRNHEDEDPAEKYYPPDLSFPVTAFLRVVPRRDGGDFDTAPQQVLLELYDPLQSSDIEIAGRRVPLESDLSTALAYYLNNPELKLDQLATLGLLRPEWNKEHAGLYMLQPYEAGKIPVLMIHGLWSSPLTWMEMFNDLRSDPQLRDHYQFWFYLYPTGGPFWAAAAKLRDDLAEVRNRVDPQHAEPALDQMVLVGHSMGGLIARMQTVDSRDAFWKIVSDKPITELKADPKAREQLEKTYYFSANPSVRRVITIGTPHHGSSFANDTTRWLSHKLIALPGMMMRDQVVKDNPGYFRDSQMLEVKTSIDSLAPDSPILPVLLETTEHAAVHYHNIVGVLPKEGFFGRVAAGSDGIVSYDSAHLEHVDSEITVPADHSSIHRHPQSVLEVRRILLEHLASLQPSATPIGTNAPSFAMPDNLFCPPPPPAESDGASLPTPSTLDAPPVLVPAQ